MCIDKKTKKYIYTLQKNLGAGVPKINYKNVFPEKGHDFPVLYICSLFLYLYDFDYIFKNIFFLNKI